MSKDDYILDEPVDNFFQLRQLDKYMVNHKGYIAGGVFKNIFNNEKFHDIDIFFKSQLDYFQALDTFKNNDEYTDKYNNDKVHAYLNKKTGVSVELIKYKFKEPLQLLDEFDFTITKFAYYKETHLNGATNEDEIEWKIAFHNKFFEHLHMKRLVINQNVNEIAKPISSFNRLFKYGKYGYFPCRETKAKIIQSIRNVPVFQDEDLSRGLYDGMD